MGLFDFIKNEFIEVIDWVDDSNNTVIAKFPNKGNKIMNGAQLTVRESQVVVLMNEGEFGDEYKPGRHELKTQNMPITTTLKSWKYLFDSPFKVDIYFVNTKQFTNLKWGTSNPIIMRDPEFKQVRIRSFGTYTIRVVDAKKFIKEFAGTNPWVTIDTVSEQLRNTIISKLSEGLAEAGVSVLDLAANFTEIGTRLKPIFQADFDAWGIELGQFYIENVSLPEEVEKMLDKTTSLNMMGDKLNQFNQMQAGIAMEKMADNPGAANTAGLGAGIVLTNMMQQAQQPQQPQQQGTSATTGNDQQKMLDLLKQLGDLKTAGILTEEEFNKKKAEILGKL
ncbi:virion core protein (lumpy skin disease virus) [Niastella yeongjuensis]|uniref:Virion core protein (Lumpy skin disease virus) n=1 Tax=Niastella yeongjuensis TaxID=354355 RepID=A0A1V9F0D8_9BACT|nr:SPFH domain-containing protein [Niastella yeongjuensis]OQP51800.1 virion core protein (lumpy skin disease virus) [Niastella yeongjuensis]SEP44667.1 Membrane protease subunit, stomatin/prohibitin family, contains C-terminal Zn-ribbon domain [Niastella yeongjuensis]